MSNLNQVILQGNLVDAPQIVGAEKNVARFTMAINNGYGEKKTTAFVDCVAFGKQAEVAGKYLSKGQQIIVRGSIVQNRWEDKDGNKRNKLEVRLENFEGFFFTGSKNAGGASSAREESEPEPEVAEKLF